MAGRKLEPPSGKKKATIAASPEDIRAATGTSDPAIAMLRLNEIGATIWLPSGEDPVSHQAKIDDLMLTLIEIEPADAFERMLAGKMIACHHAAMECYRRAMIQEQTFAGRDSSLKHAEKLSATYAKLLETLNKHRGKGQQKVTVEHVHVAAGGQAIVGNVDSGTAASSLVGRRRVAPPQLEHQVSVPVPTFANAKPLKSNPSVKLSGG